MKKGQIFAWISHQKEPKGGRKSGSKREELPDCLVQRSCLEMVKGMMEEVLGKEYTIYSIGSLSHRVQGRQFTS